MAGVPEYEGSFRACSEDHANHISVHLQGRVEHRDDCNWCRARKAAEERENKKPPRTIASYYKK